MVSIALNLGYSFDCMCVLPWYKRCKKNIIYICISRKALQLTVVSLCCVSCLLQFAPHHLLPAAQAYSRCVCLHPPGLQVVQLGDSRVYRWQTLVGVCGPHRNVTAAGR